jgi:DNA-directed RNA polymerase specialized sigma24 family protein
MTPESDGSISQCILLIKAGDHTAAQLIWERYFLRLVELARGRLRGSPRRAADEEDVALSAFDSFYQRAARGQFPQLNDRDDLWQLLIVITMRKAIDQVHHEARPRRGSGKVLALSELAEMSLEELAGAEPTPEFAAQVAEEFERLLDRLGNDNLRRVAIWKIEGYTNDEIAARIGRVTQTVGRRLAAIRQLWQHWAEETTD